jgi:hypothetical protein
MFPMHDEPDISGRSEAEFVRQKFDPAQAEKERSQHRPAKQYDELDVLVEQIDLLQL